MIVQEVLTLMDVQFIGLTGRSFYNYKIKNLFDEFKEFELSRQTDFNFPPSGISEGNHFV